MRSEELPIKEALVRLTTLQRAGSRASAKFKCENCKRLNTIPQGGLGKSIIDCGSCKETNYLTYYQVTVDAF